MKKNMLTVLILALTIINVILSGVLIFVVVPASSKTNKLISQVASVIDLELESPEDKAANMKPTDLDPYTFEKLFTINLKNSPDGSSHLIQMNVTLSMNKNSKEYGELKELVPVNESVISEIISNVYGTYTIDEAKESEKEIKEKILKQIQDYFKSDFIVSIAFGHPLYQ